MKTEPKGPDLDRLPEGDDEGILRRVRIRPCGWVVFWLGTPAASVLLDMVNTDLVRWPLLRKHNLPGEGDVEPDCRRVLRAELPFNQVVILC